jgi:uncharacterized protein YbjT (DUF2867 family)
VYAATPASTLPAKNEDTTVLVVGPTGYIGRYVTKELISRGYKARAHARRQRAASAAACCVRRSVCVCDARGALSAMLSV